MDTNPDPVMREIARLRFEQDMAPLAAIYTAASAFNWKTDAVLDYLLEPLRQQWADEQQKRRKP